MAPYRATIPSGYHGHPPVRCDALIVWSPVAAYRFILSPSWGEAERSLKSQRRETGSLG